MMEKVTLLEMGSNQSVYRNEVWLQGQEENSTPVPPTFIFGFIVLTLARFQRSILQTLESEAVQRRDFCKGVFYCPSSEDRGAF